MNNRKKILGLCFVLGICAVILITLAVAIRGQKDPILQWADDFAYVYEEPLPYEFVREEVTIYLQDKDGKWLTHVYDSAKNKYVELKAVYRNVKWTENGRTDFLGYELSDEFKKLGVVLDVKADSTTYSYGDYSLTLPRGVFYTSTIMNALSAVNKEYDKMIETRRKAYKKKYPNDLQDVLNW